jgi:pyruvate kinase
VHIPAERLRLQAPTPHDLELLEVLTAAGADIDFVAVSFVRSAADVALVKERAGVTGPRVVAKIETAPALADLDGILEVADAVMVARGDLGIECPLEDVPHLQKLIIRSCVEAGVPVITATQMLESMITSPAPTRAEVSDVANAVLDGTDAVMLSAETAAGRFPVETIQQMAAIALEAENAEFVTLDTDFANRQFGRIDQSIAMGALFTAHHLGCKAIVALTESGSTALWMSRHRIHVPIFALTSQPLTHRKMALYRNVTPLLMPNFTDRDQALKAAEDLLIERGVLMPGDTYAITCGEPMGYPGGTNMLKVCRVA